MDDNRHETLDFTIALGSPRQRGRYRVATRGLSLHLDGLAQTFGIHDLSSGGCNLYAPAELLAIGRIFDGDLHIGNTSYLAQLTIKVVRHITDHNIACSFQALSRQQEIMLDKLLLEIQKRNIANHTARRKREKDRWQHMLP